MITLYSGPLSLFARKVEIALREKGLAFERVMVPFNQTTGYDPKHPEVLALNPKGQVPVLSDCGLVLYDSTVINEYLDEAYPEPPLMPDSPVDRARCRLDELYADEIMLQALKPLMHRTTPPAPDRDRRIAREADALIASAGLDEMIRRDGVLELYESEDELRKTARDDAAKAAEGIEFRHVRGAELAELQPGLSPRITCATFIPKWQTVSDPYDYAVALAKAALARGASFRRGGVAQLQPDEAGVTVAFSDGSSLRARQVVVAGGAWSKRLTAPLGDAIPLETERGYNTTLPGYSFDLKRQLVFGGHGFVVTPLESGVRVGGAVELGGLNLPPNFKRADAMLTKAAAFMPGLVTSGGKQWMGFRPSLPDSLPAIGYSRRSRHIVYAFGHGHLGLTQSAGTGKLVTELISGTTPSLDLTPFSPQRF